MYPPRNKVATGALDQLLDSNGDPLEVRQTGSETYRRGNVKADCEITIEDAISVASFPAGLKEVGDYPATQVNGVNAASAKHDPDFDVIAITDALFIAQQRRDCGTVASTYCRPPS